MRLLLAQARGMIRDARGALRDGDPGQAGRLRENARRTSETAQTTVGDAQELVVEAGFGFGDITLLWQAQMVLERAAMRHLSRTLDRDIGEALQLIELALEELREHLAKSTCAALWLPGSTAWLFHAGEILEVLDTVAELTGRVVSEVGVVRDTAVASERARPRRGVELRVEARSRARRALGPGYASIALARFPLYADSGLGGALMGVNHAVERVTEERIVTELIRRCGLAVEAADATAVAIGRARRAAAVAFDATTAAVEGR